MAFRIPLDHLIARPDDSDPIPDEVLGPNLFKTWLDVVTADYLKSKTDVRALSAESSHPENSASPKEAPDAEPAAKVNIHSLAGARDPVDENPAAIPAIPPDQAYLAQTKDKVGKMIISIFADFTFLRQILLRHEATIHKRWSKKNRQQKLKALLSVWTDMAPSHRLTSKLCAI